MGNHPTNLTTHGKAIDEALGNIIDAAPEALKSKLADAIEAYASQRGRTFREIVRKGGLLGTLFDTIIESADARPDYGQQN